MGPVYKEGDHLRAGNWRPICCVVTEAKMVWTVVFWRIQGKLYAAGAVLKHLGGGQPPSFPWHARPQTHEIQDLNSN